MIKDTIVVPSPDLMVSDWQENRVYNSMSCLHCLPSYNYSIRVLSDSGSLKKMVPEKVSMGDRSGNYASFFSVNDHLFMVIDCDDPTINHEQWVKYYADHGVCAYFLLLHRNSTKYIFKECPIPVFPISGAIDMRLNIPEFEYTAHSLSVSREKDISVFFSGKYQHRIAREQWAQIITKKIKGSSIQRRGRLSQEQYIDMFSRAKIAWCPRTVKSRPDHECNGITPREYEAMCLEVMVIRPPIGIEETEPRTPGIHYVEVQNDNSDLLEKIEYYLEHEEEREEIAHTGRLWFERNSCTMARAYHLYDNAINTINAK